MHSKTLKNRYTTIFPIIWRQKLGLLQLLLLAAVTAVVAALAPWPLKILVDYALDDHGVRILPNASPATFVALAAFSGLLLFLANSALTVGSSWLWSKIGQAMVIDLSMRMFARLQELSRLFHTKHPIADSLNRLTVDSWCVFSIAQSLLVTPVQNLLTIITITAIAWQLDSTLTMLSLTIAPLLAISSLVFGGKIKNQSLHVREAASGVMGFVHQALGSIRLVKAFSKEEDNLRVFRNLSSISVNAAKKNTLIDQYFEIFNGLILSAGLALILFVSATRVIEGVISVGSLLIFLGYFSTLQAEAQSLLSTFKNLKTAEASLQRVMDILDADDTATDSNESKLLPRSTRLRAVSITFENVSFGYKINEPVLKSINLHIKAGQKVAFVGPSGSGKSTLASLVPRFFDVSEGEILIGEKSITDIAIKSLRDRISVVMQDSYLQPVSIADNIAYGNPNASREDIINAATSANASGFIRRLPNGYETVLGENGVNLSGGQKQRLSIARALLKNAPILILDEPTSALDNNTESLIFSALKVLMEGRTTLVIAHRLSTITDADMIVFLVDGEIVEIGQHQELIKRGGHYSRLYELQARSEQDGEAIRNTNITRNDVAAMKDESGDKAA